METLKISVIGGGFAGLYAAYRLSEKHEVTLYEEDEKVGRPKHCTGLISKWTMEKIGSPAIDSLENSFNKITFKAISTLVKFQRDTIAVKLDRVKLEQKLLIEARKNGVITRMPSKVKTVTPRGEILTVNSRKDRFDAVIIADGLSGTVSTNLGLDKSKYRKVLGVNIDVKIDHGLDLDEFNIVFSKEFRGFFGWMIPITKNKIVVGGGSTELLRLTNILSTLKIDGVIQARYGGTILTGPPAGKPYRGQVYIIGDAAGLTKPFTGGGLYPNVRVINCFQSNAMEYWSRCLDDSVKELRSQLHIARIFQEDLMPDNIADLLKIAQKYSISKMLSEKLDYDRHEELIALLLSNKVKTMKAGITYLAKHPLIGLKLMRRLLSTLII
ncbi:MAG: NAD(P)/FAD-dependent oxidoreductase [Desulfurococcales archaeon]|nr:NAD(P)/FAD-dependent oxidoreductase [Desulfurococcales archaeon]